MYLRIPAYGGGLKCPNSPASEAQPLPSPPPISLTKYYFLQEGLIHFVEEGGGCGDREGGKHLCRTGDGR